MPDSILEILRSETAIAHQQLEDLVQIGKRLSSGAAYKGLLERFFGFYEPLEERLLALEGWSEEGYAPAERRKTPWLRRDLEALGKSAAEIDALPRATELPEAATIAQGFGCAYVLEGATLGGRQISAMLQKSEIPTEARNFFASYGRAVGECWKSFIAALEEYGRGHPGEHDQTANSARETFKKLQRWIEIAPGAAVVS